MDISRMSCIAKSILCSEILRFDAYGNKVGDTQIVSMAELESYLVTNFIHVASSNDIYLIGNTIKKLILSIAVFNKYEFKWDRVIGINQTEFDYYKDGGVLE